MDDINYLSNQNQQRCLPKIVLRTLKAVYPTVEGELKDSISLKKVTVGDRDWNVSKEILGWIINTSSGTISLFPKHISDLNLLLEIPPSQCYISPKKLD